MEANAADHQQALTLIPVRVGAGHPSQIKRRGTISAARATEIDRLLASLREEHSRQLRYAGLCEKIAMVEAQRCSVGDASLFDVESERWLTRAKAILLKVATGRLCFPDQDELTDGLLAEGEAFLRRFRRYTRQMLAEADARAEGRHAEPPPSRPSSPPSLIVEPETASPIAEPALEESTPRVEDGHAEEHDAPALDPVVLVINGDASASGEAYMSADGFYCLRDNTHDSWGPPTDYRTRKLGRGVNGNMPEEGRTFAPVYLKYRAEVFFHPLTIVRAWKVRDLPRRWPHQSEKWRIMPLWMRPRDGPAALAVPFEGKPLLCRLSKRVQPGLKKVKEVVVESIVEPTTLPEVLLQPEILPMKAASFVTLAGDRERRRRFGLTFVDARAKRFGLQAQVFSPLNDDRGRLKEMSEEMGLYFEFIEDINETRSEGFLLIDDAHLMAPESLDELGSLNALVVAGSFGNSRTWNSVPFRPSVYRFSLSGIYCVSLIEWCALLGAERCILSGADEILATDSAELPMCPAAENLSVFAAMQRVRP